MPKVDRLVMVYTMTTISGLSCSREGGAPSKPPVLFVRYEASAKN